MTQKSALTVKGIESLRKKKLNKLYSDAATKSLYLKTNIGGSASWIFRWRDRRTGKLRDMGLGGLEEVSLSCARETAAELRKKVRQGADPIMERDRQLMERELARARLQTFQQVAEKYYEAMIAPTGLSDKHKRRWKGMLRLHVHPKIGQIWVSDITLSHIESVLQPIWANHLDMARKIRQIIEKILAWAIMDGLHQGPNPAVWRGNLELRLADTRAIRKAHPVEHFKAHPWEDMYNFMEQLKQRDGIAARAAEFAILTATRPGTVRFAIWDEIDLDKSRWIIPEARMRKNDKQHTVPLSKPALAILGSTTKIPSSPYIFCAPRGGPLSDMAMSKVLHRMGTDVTVQGTARSSFKDWARNKTRYADEVSELALGHVNSDSTRAAYARDELIGPRTKLMQEWADFLQTPQL